MAASRDQGRIQYRLGAFAIALSALLIGWAIPHWIAVPSNMSSAVLSPRFWPYLLAALAALVGLALLAEGALGPAADSDPVAAAPAPGGTAPDSTAPDSAVPGGARRLLAMALIMLLTLLAIERLGMVWTCMAASLATALLLRTRHPRIALVSAVVLPLLLYAFFAHIAGVAIPQGDWLRLP